RWWGWVGSCSARPPEGWCSRVAELVRRAPAPRVRAMWRAYRYLVGARIRSDWQYRTSFFLFTLAQAVVTALDLAVLLVIFDLVPALGGWSVHEVLVLYGFTISAFGLADMVASQVETVARHIV